MSNLFLTLVIAFVIIVLAIACLAIGWLIKGKARVQPGSCGHDLNRQNDQSCSADFKGKSSYGIDEKANFNKEKNEMNKNLTEEKLYEDRKTEKPKTEKEEGDKRYN